jgi:hypothetical protein
MVLTGDNKLALIILSAVVLLSSCPSGNNEIGKIVNARVNHDLY